MALWVLGVRIFIMTGNFPATAPRRGDEGRRRRGFSIRASPRDHERSFGIKPTDFVREKKRDERETEKSQL